FHLARRLVEGLDGLGEGEPPGKTRAFRLERRLHPGAGVPDERAQVALLPKDAPALIVETGAEGRLRLPEIGHDFAHLLALGEGKGGAFGGANALGGALYRVDSGDEHRLEGRPRGVAPGGEGLDGPRRKGSDAHANAAPSPGRIGQNGRFRTKSRMGGTYSSALKRGGFVAVPEPPGDSPRPPRHLRTAFTGGFRPLRAGPAVARWARPASFVPADCAAAAGSSRVAASDPVRPRPGSGRGARSAPRGGLSRRSARRRPGRVGGGAAAAPGRGGAASPGRPGRRGR